MNITYIFKNGRKKNYLNNSVEARDFYYGLFSFEKEEHKLSIIEFDEEPSPIKWPLNFIDKVLSKILNLPFNTARLTSVKNIRKAVKTDKLILVNENVACSSLFLLIFLKLFSKTEVYFFCMGLFSKKLRFKNLKFFHEKIIKIIIFFVDRVIFMGEGEYKKAKRKIKKTDKLIFLPFAIDTNFWTKNEDVNFESKDYIVFVGNDGNRNYELLLDIAKEMKEYKFIFISNNEKVLSFNQENIKSVKGSWSEKYLDDKELRDFYSKARISLIPLKESSQPSGQSVALQSMSMGVPVMITQTEGFWDKTKFNNFENIIFLESNESKRWIKIIEEIYFDYDRLKEISKNAKITVEEEYNLDSFKDKLFVILDL